MNAQDAIATPAAFDANRLARRVRALLFAPKQAWPEFAAEPATVAGLYASHAMVLAAVPALAGFIKGSMIGYGMFGATLRTPILSGLVSMLAGYLLALGLLYAVGWIINALAPTFGARKDPVQALKTATFAWTAAWIGGAGIVLPGIGTLLVLAGVGWTGYLLYLGLPHTMQCPREKAFGYTAASLVLAIVASWACALLLAGIGGFGMLTGAAAQRDAFAQRDRAEVTFDQDSAIGRLAALGERMEASTAVVAADPATLKAVLPDAIGEYERTGTQARNPGREGMQVSMASATYTHPVDQRRIVVTITDSPAAGALVGMTGAQVQEAWDDLSGRGEYTEWVDERFRVEVRGQVDDFEQLEAIADDLELSGLSSG